jgi:hypothetical protein
MSPTKEPRDVLSERIDALESGYEFLLAYAAQGRTTDKGAGAASRIREHLDAMQQALDGLGDAVRSVAATDPQDAGTIGAPFFGALDRDAATARSAIRLALSRPDISSQLVDNLNASIHLRALLTDLFVIDEVLKQRPTT